MKRQKKRIFFSHQLKQYIFLCSWTLQVMFYYMTVFQKDNKSVLLFIIYKNVNRWSTWCAQNKEKYIPIFCMYYYYCNWAVAPWRIKHIHCVNLYYKIFFFFCNIIQHLVWNRLWFLANILFSYISRVAMVLYWMTREKKKSI